MTLTATAHNDHVDLLVGGGVGPFLFERRVYTAVADPTPLYYVDFTGGNDGDNGLSAGTAWKTLAKVNGTTLSPGDVVGLKRGEAWREITAAPGGYYAALHSFESGTSGSPITFCAYGTGAKPKFLGSYDLSSEAAWTDAGSGNWVTATTYPVYIGNVLYAGPVAATPRTSLGALASQGDFYYDAANDLLYIKSTANPGTTYADFLEAIPYALGISIRSRRFLTYQNLDFRYFGQHGVSIDAQGGDETGVVDSVTVQDCNVEWIGGLHTSGAFGIGNGIEQTRYGTNIIVRRNTINQCYDAGLSHQLSDDTDTVADQLWDSNVIRNCEYGFEYWTYGATEASNILITNNAFLDCPNGSFAHALRSDPHGYGGFVWTGHTYAQATHTGCAFTGNYIDNAASGHQLVAVYDKARLTGWDFDHNFYSPDAAAAFAIQSGEGVGTYDLAGWKAASGVDASSTIADYTG